jgi:hypothetical protein
VLFIFGFVSAFQDTGLTRIRPWFTEFLDDLIQCFGLLIDIGYQFVRVDGFFQIP